MITQKQIAAQLGISQSAVACAFHPTLQRYVSPQKRQRILDTAQRAGYVAHHAGRRLSRTRSSSRAASFDQIAIIYLAHPGDPLDAVCLAMMSGAEQELSNFDASLTFVRVAQPEHWKKVERLARAGGVDGWLVYGPANDDSVDRLKSSKLPCVILGDHLCTRPVLNVNVDNRALGRMAAQQFAELGHRRVAYLGAGFRRKHQQEIFDGFRAAQREFNLIEDERLSIDITVWPHRDVARVFDWLQSHDPLPTALFVPDYGIALSVCPALQQSPVAALRQMSVLSSTVESPLAMGHDFTSIDPRFGEIGRRGISLLHSIATGGDAESVLVSPALFEGNSMRPPIDQQ